MTRGEWMLTVGFWVFMGGCVIAILITGNDKPKTVKAARRKWADTYVELPEAEQRRQDRAQLGSQAGAEITAAELVYHGDDVELYEFERESFNNIVRLYESDCDGCDREVELP